MYHNQIIVLLLNSILRKQYYSRNKIFFKSDIIVFYDLFLSRRDQSDICYITRMHCLKDSQIEREKDRAQSVRAEADGMLITDS